MGCPPSSTTRNPAEPRPTPHLRARCCRARRRDASADNNWSCTMIDKRPALGKGLSALIPDVPEAPRSGLVEVDVDRLSPNVQQPRLQMDDARLRELADSIKANGIIQP